MNLGEVKERKRELERTIERALNEWYRDTGLTVMDVKVGELLEDGYVDYSVRVKVEL
jgi:hypothetical protein